MTGAVPVPQMRRAMPGGSRVVLFGSSHYDHHLPLPGVEKSLAAVRDLLADPARGGLAPQHILVRHDTRSAQDLHSDISREAGEATDLFLLYFSGHGRIGRGNELYLTLASTAEDRNLLPYGALSLTTVRQILSECRAAAKVLILDCCFAGRAVADMAPQAEAVTAQLDISGTYVLTATQGNAQTANAPADAERTAFSGAFTEVLRTGIPGGPLLLSMDHIFTALDSRLKATGHPRPDQRNSRLINRLGLVANAARAGADGVTDYGTPPTTDPDPLFTGAGERSDADALLRTVNGSDSLASYVDGLHTDRIARTVNEVHALITSAKARHGADSAEAADLTAFLIRFQAHTANRAESRSDRVPGLERAVRDSRDHLAQRMSARHSVYAVCRARLLVAETAILRAAVCPPGFFVTYKGSAPYLNEARGHFAEVRRAGQSLDQSVELSLRTEFLTFMMRLAGASDHTNLDMSTIHKRQLELLGATHTDTQDTAARLAAMEEARRNRPSYSSGPEKTYYQWRH
ncbi:caspase domain-containing protein [Streptomyces rubiginosohelvolus]|uniref:caspase family protein n=1 Tax=Streptomyces rubiginosohelvolus TaxID=67362 RepID=UPI00380B66C7